MIPSDHLAEVYDLAYGLPLAEAAGASAGAAWAEGPACSPRRLVRAVIAAFDEVREAGPGLAIGSAEPRRAKAAI